MSRFWALWVPFYVPDMDKSGARISVLVMITSIIIIIIIVCDVPHMRSTECHSDLLASDRFTLVAMFSITLLVCLRQVNRKIHQQNK